MNIKELAQMLDGREYGHEITQDEISLAKQNNLIVVFGTSDDLMELRGAIDDEIGCYKGGSAFIETDGNILDEAQCEDCNECKYFQVAKAKAHELKACWCENDVGASWTYDIDVPFESFNIMEDGELYCVGIVFSLDSLVPSNGD
jgi:hypothetical protein